MKLIKPKGHWDIKANVIKAAQKPPHRLDLTKDFIAPLYQRVRQVKREKNAGVSQDSKGFDCIARLIHSDETCIAVSLHQDKLYISTNENKFAKDAPIRIRTFKLIEYLQLFV